MDVCVYVLVSKYSVQRQNEPDVSFFFIVSQTAR